MTPVLDALGQAPDGGFAAPAAADDGAFEGVVLAAEDGAEGFEVVAEPEAVGEVAVAPVAAAEPVEPVAPGGLAADGEDVWAPLVCDGSRPAASVAAECEPHPLTAASVISAITTAVPAVEVRDTGRTYHRAMNILIRTLFYLISYA
ncbi:MAG: hypothetical protein HOW97_18250 [Catenulispora sp.]|nr:hypothetical protein [Catenulispora sp.]